jgi:predicted ATPase/DNA-binding SARP family transcriptional activator
MNEVWQIQLLGGLSAGQGAQRISRFRTRKAAALLAYLSFHLSRTHPREDLVGLLWPDADLEAGRNNLKQALSSLRRQLEPPGTPAGAVLVTDRLTAQMNPLAIATDAAAFEASLRATARAGGGVDRIAPLAQAVEYYSGPLLPGMEEEWVWLERSRLAEAYHGALHQLTNLCWQAGDLERALEYGWRAVGVDPLDEEARYALMRLYDAAGQPQVALYQYGELKRLLQEELGEVPSEAVRALAQRLQKDTGTTEAIGHPARRGLPASSEHMSLARQAILPASGWAASVTPSLPVSFTRFFNRTEEIARLRAMLGDQTVLGDRTVLDSGPEVRLVTLTGIGGAGKTRLAMEAAHGLAEQFDGAVWFVPLADLRDASLIGEAVADALRLPRSSARAPLDQVLERLADQPALLVLDNFEHLVEEGSQTIQRLLEGAPALKCVVTSRQILGLSAEYEMVISPLPTPLRPATPEQLIHNASVQLFVDRAQRTRPDFQVSTRNAAAVAALCEQLEGIPLALELAAARSAILTPRQMLDQLGKRLTFLTSSQRDLPERHRSLGTAIEWSYRLLPPPTRQLFARLSVFCGGWNLEGAEGVCGGTTTLECLRTLRAGSLLTTETVGAGEAEHVRYRMFETLRAFGREQLSPEEALSLARRHAGYFLHLAAEAGTRFHGPEQAIGLDRLEAEHDNLRAALAWLLDHEAETALTLAGRTWPFWELRGFIAEGRRWLSQALAASAAQVEARAQVLHGAGVLADAQDDRPEALDRTEESVALFRKLGARRGLAYPLAFLGYLYRANDTERAHALLEESLAVCRAEEDKPGLVYALCCLGRLAQETGRYAEARAASEESLVVARLLGHRQGIAESLNLLGTIALRQDDYAAAQPLLEECLALYRESGNRKGITYTLRCLGEVLLAWGQYDQARLLLQESLTLLREIGNARNLIGLLQRLRVVAECQGDAAAAQAFGTEERALGQLYGSGAPMPLKNEDR